MTTIEAVVKDVLARIHDGKGKDRHGDDVTPFEEQLIFTIPRNLLSNETPLLFQAVKKIFESQRLAHEPARDELLDAIAYLIAAVMYKDEYERGV